jgi:hypothetical protein
VYVVTFPRAAPQIASIAMLTDKPFIITPFLYSLGFPAQVSLFF